MTKADHTLISRVCGEVRHLPGVAVEFGVYQGESLAVICDELAPTMVWGLDSFRGLPAAEPCDGNHAGLFGDTSEERVRQAMEPRTNYRLVPGWFADTLPTLDVDAIKFAHLDCDHYRSYRQALEWLWPRLVVGGKAISDDYAAPSCQGAKKAVDEWTAAHADCEPEPVTHSRIVLVKTEA